MSLFTLLRFLTPNASPVVPRAGGDLTEDAYVGQAIENLDTYAARINGTNTFTSANTFSALQTFSSGISADGSHTATIPSATDTLVGKATTDVLTNKTLTAPTITAPTVTGIASITVANGGFISLAAASPNGGFTVPGSAGAAPTVDTQVAFDTTAHKPVWGSNGKTMAASMQIELAYAQVTGSQAITSTTPPGTDLTSLTVTCTPDGVHPVMVEVFIPVLTATSNSGVVIDIQKDGSAVQSVQVLPLSTGAWAGAIKFRDAAPTNASHTYKVSAYSGGAQTVTFFANGTAYIRATQVQN